MRSTLPTTVIYVLACLLTTHTAHASETEGLAALRDGSLKKLIVHDSPARNTYEALVDRNGQAADLENFESAVLVVNFFAVWCAPCRIEMPSLDRLQSRFDPEDLTVIVVATGRHAEGAIDGFLTETGIARLTVLEDPTGAFTRSLGVFGLPTTLLLDPDRQEVARLVGDADWDSDSSVTIITHMLEN